MPQLTGSNVSANVTGSGGDMHITPEERERFTAAFNSCNPVDGHVNGGWLTDLRHVTLTRLNFENLQEKQQGIYF